MYRYLGGGQERGGGGLSLEPLHQAVPATAQVTCLTPSVHVPHEVPAANIAHIRQSGPDSAVGFQVKVLKPFQVVPSSLGSGL